MAQVAELHEKLAAMGRERAGSPPPTGADARAAGELMERVERVEDDVSLLIGARDGTKTALAGAKFTCFTRTKVLALLVQKSLLIGARHVTKTALAGAKFTCFTSTKVQILTPEALADAEKRAAATGAEIRHVDERVGELFDKVEALAAEVLDAKPLREVDALQNAFVFTYIYVYTHTHTHVYARQSFFFFCKNA
jgi:hypothetical protein